MKMQINANLREEFRPEFLNRIDEVIFFCQLKIEDLMQIATKMLVNLSLRLQGQGIYLVITEEALELLSKKAYEPQCGARNLDRVIRQKIEIPLSELKHMGNLVGGQKVVVYVSKGELEIQVSCETSA